MYYTYSTKTVSEGNVILEEECVVPEAQTGVIIVKKIPMKKEDAIANLEKKKAERAKQLLYVQTQMAAEVASIDAVLAELKS